MSDLQYKPGDKVRFETTTKIPRSNRKGDYEAGHEFSRTVHRGTVVERDGGIVFITDDGQLFPEYLADNIIKIYSID